MVVSVSSNKMVSPDIVDIQNGSGLGNTDEEIKYSDSEVISSSSLTSCSSLSESENAEFQTFEGLLKACGDAGYWQIKIFVLASFCGFLTALHNLAYAFIGATPDHWCRLPTVPGLTGGQIKNLTIPNTSAGQFNQCSQYPIQKDTSGIGSTFVINRTLTQPCTAFAYNHSEFETTIVTEWDLVCERATLGSSVQGIYMIGVLVGSPVFGLISDRAGRRSAIRLASIIFALSAPLVALMPNYTALLIARFVLGASSPGLYGTSFVLAVEVIGLEWRGVAGNLFCLPFAFGYMALPGFAYFVRSWRSLQLTLSVPIIIQVFICCSLPESPRWLLRKGKLGAAERVLNQVAAANGKAGSLPPDFHELIQLVGTKEIEPVLKRNWKERLGAVFREYVQLLRTPKLRLRTLVLYLCWLSVSMVYYGVAMNSPNLATSPYMYTFLGGILELPSYLMVPPLIKCFGRRFTFAGFFLLCGASLLCSLMLEPDFDGVVVLALTGKILIGAAYALIYLYATELLPTHLRGAGVGSACMAGHVGSAMSPYIVDQLGQRNPTYPTIVFGSLSVLAGLFALLLPETRDRGLPDTVSDVEKVRAK